MTGFCMKFNTGLKWVDRWLPLSLIISHSVQEKEEYK